MKRAVLPIPKLRVPTSPGRNRPCATQAGALAGAPRLRQPAGLLAGLLVACAISTVATRANAQPVDEEWGVEGGQERRAEIIRRYRAIIEARPEEGPIFDRLVAEVGTGLAALADEYAALREEEPGRLAWALIHGHLLRRLDRLDEAARAYEAATAIDPSSGVAFLSLGETYRRLDRRADAETAFETALSLVEGNDDRRTVLRSLADLAFDAHDWEAASGYVERIVAIEPENAWVRAELAELFVRHRRYDEAVAQYREIVERAGTDTRQRAVAMRDLGDVLVLMGSVDEAIEEYRSAMRLVDRSYWLYRELQQRIVQAYRASDRLEELVAEFEEDWASPSFEQAMLLAGLYDELGREDDALAALRRAVRLESGSIDARLALIQMLERRGETDEVMEQYRTLARQNPGDASYRFRIVDIYRRQGERETAIRELGEIGRRFSDSVDVQLQLADRYQRLGLDDEALACYERVVEIDPEDPDNLVALGEFHFMEGRRTQADSWWRRVLEVIEVPGEAHARLAEIYADHMLQEEAVEEWEEALEVDAENELYRRGLARALQTADRHTLALREWTRLFEETEQEQLRAEARTAMVEIYDELGQLRDVIPAWRERFVAEQPELDAGWFLAEAYRELEDVGNEEATYDEILVHWPEEIGALVALERIYSRQNRIADSIRALEQIAQAAPERARECFERLAELSLRRYDDAEAIRFAQLAVELNPDDASAHARLGQVYRQMQDLDNALLAFRQAIELNPRAFAYQFELAEILLAMDRPTDADELYRSIVSESQDAADVLRAGRRSILIHQARGTLSELMAEVEPLAYRGRNGDTYLKLLIELIERLAAPLVDASMFGLPGDQEHARAELQELGRRALRPLLDALVGDDISLRGNALRILGAIENAGAATAVARLLDETDSSLQLAAALAVARIGDERVVQPLLRALSSSEPGVQRLSAWALGRIGSDESRDALIALAGDEARPDELRALALVAIGRNRWDEGQAVVESAVVDDSTLVQHAAIWAAGAGHFESLSDELRLLVAHGRNDVPLASAESLGMLPATVENVEVLADAWVLGGDALRGVAARTLTAPGEGRVDEAELRRFERAMPFWDAPIEHFDVGRYVDGLREWGVVSFAADPEQSIARWGDLIVASIGRGLEDERTVALTLLRDLDAAPDRLGLASMEDASGGDEAWGRLAQTGVSGAVPALIALVRGGDRETARLACSVLGKAGVDDEPVLDALRWAAGAEDARLRGSAVIAWARLRPEEAGPFALDLVDDPSWEARCSSAVALGIWGGAEAVEALAELFRNDAWASVRETAVDALSRAAPDRAWEEVQQAWPLAPPTLRAQIVALASRWSPERSGLLIEWAGADGDARVRAMGARVAGAPRE